MNAEVLGHIGGFLDDLDAGGAAAVVWREQLNRIVDKSSMGTLGFATQSGDRCRGSRDDDHFGAITPNKRFICFGPVWPMGDCSG